MFHSVFITDPDIPSPNLGPHHNPVIPNINIDANGGNTLLSNIKPHKAAGPDGVPAQVLKELKDAITPVLTDIFQKSLDSGELPADWREANIAAVYKKGERYKALNYRPISLISICCKVMEHVIASNIMHHLEGNNILYELQQGFRSMRSCEIQLLSLIDKLTKTKDNKVQTDVIIMDFTKAFDKVSHSRLLLKLNHYGVQGKTNQWIKNLLSDSLQ